MYTVAAVAVIIAEEESERKKCWFFYFRRLNYGVGIVRWFTETKDLASRSCGLESRTGKSSPALFPAPISVVSWCWTQGLVIRTGRLSEVPCNTGLHLDHSGVRGAGGGGGLAECKKSLNAGSELLTSPAPIHYPRRSLGQHR